MTDKPVMPELTKDTYTREEVEALLQDVIKRARVRLLGISELNFKASEMAAHIIDAVGGPGDKFVVVEMGNGGKAKWRPRTYEEAIATVEDKLAYMFDRISPDFKLDGNVIVNETHGYRMWAELQEVAS